MTEENESRLFRLWQRGATPRAAATRMQAHGVVITPDQVLRRYVEMSHKF